MNENAGTGGGTGGKTVIIDNTNAGYQAQPYNYGQPQGGGYGQGYSAPIYDPAYNMGNQYAQPYYGGPQQGYPQQGYPQQGYNGGPVMG